MKTPEILAVQDVLHGESLRNLDDYNVILTSSAYRPYYRASCRLPFAGGAIVMLDAACVKNTSGGESLCSGGFDFTVNGWLDPASINGFSMPENHGHWTDGKNASFSCTVGGKVPTRVRVLATPYTSGAHTSQRLIASINSSVHEFKMSNISGGKSIEIPLPPATPGEKLEIRFHMPDAISPMQASGQGDKRVLGFTIRSIEFD